MGTVVHLNYCPSCFFFWSTSGNSIFLFAVSTFLSISQPITLFPTPLLPLCQGFQWVLKTHKPTCLSSILNLFVFSVAGSAIHHLSPWKSLFFHGFPETTLSFISFYFLIILSPWLASLPLFFPYTTCLLTGLFLFSPHSRALHDLIYSPPSTIILISHHLSSFLNPSHGVRLCSWTSISNFTKLTQSKAYPLSPPTSSLLLSLQSLVALTIQPGTGELDSEPHLPHGMWF